MADDDPIMTPDGKTLRTLQDAEYVLTLPQTTQDEPQWQRAAGDLTWRPSTRPMCFFARSSFYRAVHGDVAPPIGKTRPTKAEHFKAKRQALKQQRDPTPP